ncbi:MAG: ElyC/SanA/YdcF family protein [Patescibacteria group bacterium]
MIEKPPSAEIIEQKKRVMVYLGARMTPRNIEDEGGKKKWAFKLFTPNQTNAGTSLPGEVSGGFSRQEAVKIAYEDAKKTGEEIIVLATGGNEKSGDSRADEAAKRLVDTEGIAKEDVVSIGGQGSTLGNAGATLEYIQAHKEDLGDVKKVEIVTNDFHMLRAWVMFSQAMLKLTADKDLEITPEEKEKIYSLLEEGTPKEEGVWDPKKIKETREKVMEILKPKFEASTIAVSPVVAEEVLENTHEESKVRYAHTIRNNKWVTKTVQFEYKGMRDLLDGKYKGK